MNEIHFRPRFKKITGDAVDCLLFIVPGSVPCWLVFHWCFLVGSGGGGSGRGGGAVVRRARQAALPGRGGGAAGQSGGVSGQGGTGGTGGGVEIDAGTNGCALLAGLSFLSIDERECGCASDSGAALCHWRISFTDATAFTGVTWITSSRGRTRAAPTPSPPRCKSAARDRHLRPRRMALHLGRRRLHLHQCPPSSLVCTDYADVGSLAESCGIAEGPPFAGVRIAP